jgi:hypothetical protein
MRKLARGVREAVSSSAPNATTGAKRSIEGGDGSNPLVGGLPRGVSLTGRSNPNALIRPILNTLTLTLIVVAATLGILAGSTSTAQAQYVGPYNSCHHEDIGQIACVNGLRRRCEPGQDSDGDGVWINAGDGACQPSGSDSTGTVCLAAAYRPSEDQGGGVFPKYVYVSAPFTTPGSVGAFVQYVRRTYGFAPNGTPDLNIYRWVCLSGDTNAITQSFMQSVEQDGGTAGVNEVPTGWSP